MIEENDNVAQTERDRIISIIQRRIDVHYGFVESCMDHEIEVRAGVLSALGELRALLREIEK
jgi:uncharacterized membrane protein YczE